MIERDPGEASRVSYDLLVVGGGIHGVALTLEAARRGLRPLLLEKDDFGGGASWNSLRIVHGGLRYLQTFDLRRIRESVAERRWYLSEFPDLVFPLSCLMPLYGDGLHRPGVLRLALAVNDLLSRTMNEGVPAARALARGRVLSVQETVERFPAADREGLKGAALWHDAVIPSLQRLLIEMLHWSCACGARALNYVEGKRLVLRDGGTAGVEAVDNESGDTLLFQAPVVVNCAGPWCREVAERFDRDIPELFAFSIAFNALLDREPLSDAALAVTPRGREGRTYFLLPSNGRILAGTFHAVSTGSRPNGRVEAAMLDAFLGDLNAAIPSLAVSAEEVLRLHWGFLPAKRPGSPEQAVREVVHHHADHGGPRGLFSVSGVKYTTARRVAEKALRRILAWRGGGLPAAGDGARPAASRTVPESEVERLLESGADAVGDQVRSLVERESVLHLDDLILRRTNWGADPRRGIEIGTRIARQTGWDESRVDREVERLARVIHGEGVLRSGGS
jgi:glycerol-3-phosphate dehydrogenase